MLRHQGHEKVKGDEKLKSYVSLFNNPRKMKTCNCYDHPASDGCCMGNGYIGAFRGPRPSKKASEFVKRAAADGRLPCNCVMRSAVPCGGAEGHLAVRPEAPTPLLIWGGYLLWGGGAIYLGGFTPPTPWAIGSA